MSQLASPLQVASVANALAWPLIAGAAVVAWSRLRAAEQARRAEALDSQLRAFHRSVESRPVTARLSMVVDALEEGEELAADAAAQAKSATPARS